MSLTLHTFEVPVRLKADAPLSVEAFWSFAQANPDQRMEREPNGEITLMSPVNGRATLASALVVSKLFAWADSHGNGNVLDSNGACLLPDGSIRCADAAWLSHARWTPPSITDDAPAPCPEFVIEVRSGSDRLKLLEDKMLLWISNGVELAWLVDPVRKAVEVYRPGREPEVLEEPVSVAGEGPVSGFVLELGKVWG